ncbi:MAG: hypothetical protein MHPSP_000331 [Paramarteilia canceri]
MVAKMNRTFAEKEIKKIIRYKFGAKNALYNQLSSLQTQINLTRAQIELLDLIPEAYDMESLKLHTDSLGTRARKILSDSLDQNCSNSSSSFNDVSSSENDSEIKNIKDDSPKNFKSPQKVVLKCSCCGDLCQTASPSLLDVNDSLMDYDDMDQSDGSKYFFKEIAKKYAQDSEKNLFFNSESMTNSSTSICPKIYLSGQSSKLTTE